MLHLLKTFVRFTHLDGAAAASFHSGTREHSSGNRVQQKAIAAG
jgi:hypothetical protein